jgi:hypothetical protein
MARDHIDQMCEEWARVRRELLGIRRPLRASDYLGPIRCTIGQRRDLHAGSSSTGRVEQHFPEVYMPGNQQLVNTVFHRMPPCLAEIMDWHYVLEVPRDKRLRADQMGLSTRVYWERVRRAKTFIEGAVAIVDSVRTQSA